MNTEEIKLIADAHGWAYHLGLGGSEFFVSQSQEVAARDNDGRWQLSEVGAFRVIVEAKLTVEPSIFGCEGRETWAWTVESRDTVYPEPFADLREAVAQARIHMLTEVADDD